MEILKIACKKKLKSLKKWQKYKATNMGLIFHKIDHSIHAKDREYIYEGEVKVDYKTQKRQRLYEEQLELERERKKMEIRERMAKETLYQDEEDEEEVLQKVIKKSFFER